MDVVSALLHSLNILLIGGLLVLYSQNYRRVKSKYTAGLLVFALVFLLQSVMGLYFDASMVMYQSREAEAAALALELIKAASFGIMLWVSWE